MYRRVGIVDVPPLFRGFEIPRQPLQVCSARSLEARRGEIAQAPTLSLSLWAFEHGTARRRGSLRLERNVVSHRRETGDFGFSKAAGPDSPTTSVVPRPRRDSAASGGRPVPRAIKLSPKSERTDARTYAR